MARPVGSSGGSTKRALAIRMAIEDRLNGSIPEKIADLLYEMEDPKDKLEVYKVLLPYMYPKLIAQVTLDAADIGIETEAATAEKRAEEWKALQLAKNDLKSA